MKSYKTEQIRNVGVFSHGGTGKTSLVEAMLYATGVLSRLGRVEEGNTTTDFEPEEIKRRISVSLALAPCEWKDNKINLLDTPGYSDFVGEVLEAMRVADAALIVVCAVAGIEVGTELVWKYADERHLPRFVFVNRIDRENADFARVVNALQERFGATSLIPIQLPIGSQDKFQGVVDLVHQKAYLGTKGEEAPIPAEMKAAVEAAREKLIEAAAETDDALIEKYLGGEPLTNDELLSGLKTGIQQRKIIPILVGSATANKAIPPLLDAIVDYLPSPAQVGDVKAQNVTTNAEESLPPSDTAPLSVLAFKTTADPFVGKLTYLRVYSGVLRSDSRVFNPNRNFEERLGQLFVMVGKNQTPVVQLPAGDIGAVAKLQETATGDTLCAREHPVILPAIRFPKPLFTSAVFPKTKTDLDKMGPALKRLVEEDPTVLSYREQDTNESILATMGESHADVCIERMKRKFGVDLLLNVPKIPYKATISTKVNSHHRHKKQTGGHGQFGEVYVELEPLPRGSGNEFTERVVGGAVPKNYIPSVEKGFNTAVAEGVAALGYYPVTDVRMTLYDGSYHPVDSSDFSFQIAGSMALKKGMEDPAARPTLLEPIVSMTITVPDANAGDVMGDLNANKRGRILGMEPAGHGTTIISAEAPLAEVQRYATDLRSITQGRGYFSMEMARYEEVPGHLAQAIIEAALKEREEANKA